MDLHSFISLKEAYTQVGSPQQLTESVDSIWEEVEAFAHALVEEEGLDLSDMTWDEVYEAYMSEDFFSKATGKDEAKMKADKEAKAARVNRDNAVYRAGGGDAARKTREANKNGNRGFGGRNGGGGQAAYETRKQGEDNLFKAGGGNAASKNGLSRQQIIDKGIKASGSGSKTTTPVKKDEPNKKPVPTPTPTPNSDPKPKPTSTPTPAAKVTPKAQTGNKKADMASWSKANPKLAAAKAKRDATRGTSASSNPLMRDLAKRMPKPAAPAAKVTPKAATPVAAKPAPVAAKPAPVAAKRPMLSKAAPKTGAAASSALNSFAKKPMNEESEFDIILTHLIEQGFGDDEALKIMVNMPEDTRMEILAVMNEEESDARKDKQLENGGHAAKTDYTKTPAANTWGKKKMSAEEREEARKKAFSKVVGDLKKKHGEKAIKSSD